MATSARTEFAAALNQIASEKGVEPSIVLEAIETAALAAFRKDLTLQGTEIPEDFDSYTAKIDPVTGEISIFDKDKNITPPGFARIAAQTAKQVIMQKLFEAEKGAMMDEYDKKVGTVVSATLSRQEGNNWFVDLGRAEGIMPGVEQTRDEYYHQGQRLKVLIKEIREGRRGPEVVVSRSDANLVKGLFGLEVPEIQSGSVVIKEIAREAGGRCKLAAVSTQEGVDPVGSLVGQKGVRVQAVMQELGEEKIDIISYSDDPSRFIAAALSPAKDLLVDINEEEKTASVKVPDSQLSLAIGKGGQNVRLAAKLTNYRIDIKGMGDSGGSDGQKIGESDKSEAVKSDTPTKSDSADIPTEDGTHEADAESAATVMTDDGGLAPVEAAVEEEIEKAAEEEGAPLPEEPSVTEAAQAAPVAEADIAEEDKKDGDKN